jgi:hypothetical protein
MALLSVILLGGVFMAGSVKAQSTNLAQEAQAAIASAEAAVEQARTAIEKGKELITTIPEDSPLLPDVAQFLQAASVNWNIAVESLDGAKQSASKITTATSESIARDYALLSKVNAGVALSGANVVQIGLAYVEAVAANKTEALDIIRTSMQDALAASSQVQFNYERVKTLIAEKYSN